MLGGFQMIWKGIPGFSEYEVSENGDIRKSLFYIRPKRTPGHKKKPGQLLRPNKSIGYGYYGYTLRNDNGIIRNINAHVAMALAFIGPRPFPKAQARHLNDDRSNNHISNISWGTASDNQQDCIRNGNRPLPPNARFTVDEIRKIRKLSNEGLTGYRLSKLYKTAQRTMYDIINHKIYKDET